MSRVGMLAQAINKDGVRDALCYTPYTVSMMNSQRPTSDTITIMLRLLCAARHALRTPHNVRTRYPLHEVPLSLSLARPGPHE